MKKSEFIPTVGTIVMTENAKRGYPLFSSVVIAQAICESGWGQSTIMMKANAIFGIKATKSWKGKVYNAKTQECYDGVTYTDIKASFRAYDSLVESVADYFDLITKSSRYKKALKCNSPLECIQAIKDGGYATSPVYVNTIMSIINSNNLIKYDELPKDTDSVGENVKNYVERFEKGKVYTLQVDLNVRTGAGTNYRVKKYKELTADGKNHAFRQEKAVLKTGTRITCLNVIKEHNNIWLQIPSGFVAGFYNGKEYIK